MSDVSGRSGIFEMGCSYACGVCISMSGDESICQLKGNMNHCGVWMGSVMCAICNCCYPCCGRIGSVIVIS